MTLNVRACRSTGLTGPAPDYFPLSSVYPDGHFDLTHVIKGPQDVIELTGISNGDCNFAIQVNLGSPTGTLLADSVKDATYGLTYSAVTKVQDATDLTWSVSADASISIQLADETIDGVSLPVFVTVSSLIDALDTSTYTFSFTIEY